MRKEDAMEVKRQRTLTDKREAKRSMQKKIPKGFFAISKPQISPDDLREMEKFLNRQRIRTVMVQAGPYVVLCREGVEARGIC